MPARLPGRRSLRNRFPRKSGGRRRTDRFGDAFDPRATREPMGHPDLLADAEFRDDGLVALGIVFLEVVEQATPLADQH